jgi:serine phosphatase RsbU (regulator of sigma subunit)
MRIEVAWAKLPKGGFGESGDSIELVERPLGGLSLILADGQGSGPAAQRIARMVAMKAVGLISEGTRDGAVARAVQDMLYTARAGRVTATLSLLTADLYTRSLLISRNAACPVLVRQEGQVFRIEGHSEVIGTYRKTRPAITELPLSEESVLVTFSDGILTAGRRFERTLDWERAETELLVVEVTQLSQWVEDFIDRAVQLDGGRPQDDMSVMAMGVRDDDGPSLRRLYASIPY